MDQLCFPPTVLSTCRGRNTSGWCSTRAQWGSFYPQSKQEDWIRMDVYVDVIGINNQWQPPLYFGMNWNRNGSDSSDWYVFNPIGFFSSYLCSSKHSFCVFRLLLANLYLKSQWYLLLLLCVSYRQQKEEDEELERILQLSLTEK